MDGSNSARSWAGPVLAAFASIFLFILFLLLDHPETAVLLFSLPSPAAFACNIRCLGIGPTLQVIGEGGRALLLMVLSISFFYAVVRCVRRVLRTRAFLDEVERKTVRNDGIAGTVASGNAILFDDSRPLAFTGGFLEPKVFISTKLTEVLSGEEVRAVVLHELHHRAARDPLKSLLASFLSDFLFFVPAGRFLKASRSLAAEFAADEYSLAGDVDAADLAGSLLKVQRAAAPAISGFFDPTTERAKRLLGEPSSVRTPLARFLLSIFVLAVAAWIATVPIKKSVSDLFLNHDKTCVLRSGPQSPAEAVPAEGKR